MEYMSQEEKDMELVSPKKDEDFTISIHCGICICEMQIVKNL